MRRSLAQTKVSYLDVPLHVEHDVVQLEVPVDDPVLMQEHDRGADLGSVESVHHKLDTRPGELNLRSEGLLELAVLLDVEHEVAPGDVLQHEVEV